MAISKDHILKVDDLRTEEVHVPEWADENGDDVVYVKSLTGKQRDAYEQSMWKLKDGERVQDLANARAKLVVRSLVFEGGKRMFADDDAATLGNKSAEVIDRLFDIARNMSGMADEDSVADAKGNSEAAQSGTSTSDSPESSDEQSENS